MSSLLFYPGFIATVISIIGLSRIAYKYHSHEDPHNLSELAAAEDRLLTHFRNVLWTCGTLFALTVYGFLVPRIIHPALLFAAWTVTYSGNLVLAVVPARGKSWRLHTIFAQSMGVGMLAMSYIFWSSLQGRYKWVEMIFALVMSLMALLTYTDKRRFILYELTFLYLSHISIITAALALR